MKATLRGDVCKPSHDKSVASPPETIQTIRRGVLIQNTDDIHLSKDVFSPKITSYGATAFFPYPSESVWGYSLTKAETHTHTHTPC